MIYIAKETENLTKGSNPHKDKTTSKAKRNPTKT